MDCVLCAYITEHLSALVYVGNKILTSEDVSSLLFHTIKYLHDLSFPSLCSLQLNWNVISLSVAFAVQGDGLICIQHVACNEKRWQSGQDCTCTCHVPQANLAEQNMKMCWAKWSPTPPSFSSLPLTVWLIYKLWPFSSSFLCRWKKIRWSRLLWTSSTVQSIRLPLTSSSPHWTDSHWDVRPVTTPPPVSFFSSVFISNLWMAANQGQSHHSLSDIHRQDWCTAWERERRGSRKRGGGCGGRWRRETLRVSEMRW